MGCKISTYSILGDYPFAGEALSRNARFFVGRLVAARFLMSDSNLESVYFFLFRLVEYQTDRPPSMRPPRTLQLDAVHVMTQLTVGDRFEFDSSLVAVGVSSARSHLQNGGNLAVAGIDRFDGGGNKNARVKRRTIPVAIQFEVCVRRAVEFDCFIDFECGDARCGRFRWARYSRAKTSPSLSHRAR